MGLKKLLAVDRARNSEQGTTQHLQGVITPSCRIPQRYFELRHKLYDRKVAEQLVRWFPKRTRANGQAAHIVGAWASSTSASYATRKLLCQGGSLP